MSAILKIHVIKSPNLSDWLTLVAIRSDERKKSRERAHLANVGVFNRRYLTCQISAILYAIAAPGTPSDFRRSAYKIARCVTGFRQGNRGQLGQIRSSHVTLVFASQKHPCSAGIYHVLFVDV